MYTTQVHKNRKPATSAQHVGMATCMVVHLTCGLTNPRQTGAVELCIMVSLCTCCTVTFVTWLKMSVFICAFTFDPYSVKLLPSYVTRRRAVPHTRACVTPVGRERSAIRRWMPARLSRVRTTEPACHTRTRRSPASARRLSLGDSARLRREVVVVQCNFKIINIITSAKEVKFLPDFVCLFVCVLAR